MVCKIQNRSRSMENPALNPALICREPGITGIRINSNTSSVMMMHMHKNSFTVLRGYAAGKIWRIPSYSPRPFK